MKWRLIEQETYNAETNMAIDHAIYESVANGRELPTMRFYKWLPSSVSLGAYQNPKEINLDACKRHNIGIVRRMTGGRAVFHDKADFTYSVIAPIRMFKYSIENAYREICYCIINALHEIGINAALENKNDVVVDSKKISGNAAKAMDKGIYLQHGTLVYDLDFEIMPEVLNISKGDVQEKVASILQYKKASKKAVYTALKDSFAFGKDFQTEELSRYELMRAQDLASSNYNTIFLPAGSFMKNKGACYVERGG
ncbi:lipoate--protein ligase family protein [Candidatus Woesearchaeota archaeon]|nr:lipoate--protein ligase family protein [Candidatus Woesearchaeota archaeon]